MERVQQEHRNNLTTILEDSGGQADGLSMRIATRMAACSLLSLETAILCITMNTAYILQKATMVLLRKIGWTITMGKVPILLLLE
jgi:hypothetical protein